MNIVETRLCDELLDELADLTGENNEVYSRCIKVAAGFLRAGERHLAIKLIDAVKESRAKHYVEWSAKPLSGDALARYKSELVE